LKDLAPLHPDDSNEGFRLGNQAGVKLSALAANRAIESVEYSKNPVSQPMNSGIPEYLRLWFIAIIIM
jgi:hypothetical protein